MSSALNALLLPNIHFRKLILNCSLRLYLAHALPKNPISDQRLLSTKIKSARIPHYHEWYSVSSNIMHNCPVSSFVQYALIWRIKNKVPPLSLLTFSSMRRPSARWWKFCNIRYISRLWDYQKYSTRHYVQVYRSSGVTRFTSAFMYHHREIPLFKDLCL